MFTRDIFRRGRLSADGPPVHPYGRQTSASCLNRPSGARIEPADRDKSPEMDVRTDGRSTWWPDLDGGP